MKKMKIKRFAAIFLAVMLALSCGLFAMAAPVDPVNTSGSITVNAQAAGRSFAAYEILKMAATGATGNSYVVAPGANNYLQSYLSSKGVAKSGSTYKDSEIVNYIVSLDNAGVQALADDFALTAVKTGYTYYPLSEVGTSGTTTTYKASGVNLGYYIIMDTAADKTTNASGYTPSIVMLNTVDNNVNITAKDTTTSGDKKIGTNNTAPISYSSSADYSIGQTVPYQLSAEIPADTNQKTGLHNFSVNLNDALASGLAYQKIDSITIKRDGAELSGSELTAFLAHASLTIGSGTPIAGADIASHYSDISGAASFSFNFDLFSKGNGADYDLLNNKPVEILVNYSGVITSDAVINNPLTNTYTLTFGRNGDKNTITKTANVYTYGLQLTKTNTDGVTLPGATFVLQSPNGKYISFIYDKSTKIYTVAGYSDTLPDAYDAYKLLSGDNGLITINGLDASDNYTLTEKVAPLGYNILTAPQTVKVSSDTSQNSDEYSQLTVQDSKSVVLPFTGGTGTLMFSIGGVVILLGAVAFLLLNRKKIFKS